ncbi:MAG: aminopeptidase P N-terminal domain-containing protein, partial [Muribaculaceae bacterium]|nr:aminopeptidase P N-terminal domain-containing protein [Muribaculaceae bacterium]
MFDKEIYVKRRQELKERVGSGMILLLGNEEVGCNYEDNTYPYRQDSTFLYYFGLPFAGLNAIIDVDNNREIIFGDELTIDHIVWMGTQPTLHEKAHRVGVDTVLPSAELRPTLDKARAAGQKVHYLPVYRPEHSIKLFNLLDVRPGTEQPSVDLIRAVVDMRNHKAPEEIKEIERWLVYTSAAADDLIGV